MAKKKKSLQQRADELVAKRLGISYRSAQRRRQRAAKSGKAVKAPKSLSDYGKKLFRSAVSETKKAAAAKPKRPKKQVSIRPPAEEFGEQVDRVNFKFGGLELMKMFGSGIELGSSGSGDIRSRWIRERLGAQAVNEVLNAETIYDAADIFQSFVPYLVSTNTPEKFEFRGVTYGREFFN